MNKKELIKLLDKYEIEYEITDNTKEVEEGLRLLDEALEKIGIIIPKETQVDTITTENDTEVPKYTTEWASSSDLISRQGAINAIPQTSVDLFENCRNCELLDREQVVDILESLPPVEPPKKVVAQFKVDTEEIVERIKEEYEIKDRPVCEDAISKHDLWRIIEDNAYWVTYNETSKEKGMTLTGINQALNECSPVTPIIAPKPVMTEEVREALQDDWIPVSDDTLPEPCTEVQVTCEVRYSDGMKHKYQSIAQWIPKNCEEALGINWDVEATEYNEEKDEYYPLEGWYESIKNWDEFSLVAISDFVVAWRPLPEPYKTDMRGKE